MDSMTHAQWRQWMLKRLFETGLVFHIDRSPEELELLADLWAEALPREPQTINAAFVAWRREGRRFPVPADIIDRLPACRAAQDAAAALSEAGTATRTPGYPAFLAARRSGDDDALAALEQEYGREAMRRFENLLAGAVAACDVRQ
ncbi:hypothetical protein [uncultured Desulfovibrio sp.]|uniref:hypothetical protein n=1 Tax=uncultured Desulfovibrio sp. TaxID=167968 RepID=UPI0026105670|nr:hypothetical protein [uncultured Desulfovibrio sp.]